ncbi:hypothetical protein BUALT_Bualt03G0051100 [Buddleja alternifolia]|uniref:Uncharacterized protein n=1 Tax=Buddleja alternifolia TaxID=168488 RepID=A0AAV6Y209_9LAMI|nr:hypothetical protein BUALT_Bualt03G0051100 [Buddleja alternifolia]
MSDPQIPEPNSTKKPSPPADPPKIHGGGGGGGFSQGRNFPNPPDSANPDAATLRDQWRFAIRQYSKWYSHAWGTAILAGLSFFALGWVIKGSNPIPSFNPDNKDKPSSSSSDEKDKAAAAEVHRPR